MGWGLRLNEMCEQSGFQHPSDTVTAASQSYHVFPARMDWRFSTWKLPSSDDFCQGTVKSNTASEATGHIRSAGENTGLREGGGA